MTAVEFIQSQHFPAGSEPEDVYVWVQSDNHQWVSEFTGVELKEVETQYLNAFAKGLICIAKLKWEDIKERNS